MERRITKRAIAALQPADVQTWLYDTELRGFAVLCQPSGRKSYIARFKAPNGRWRKTTIASCAELEPEKARDRARDIMAAARNGEDPVAWRQQQADQPTVADLADRFMREHASKKKPGTRQNYAILWAKHITPRMGKLRVADVKRIHVQRVHGDMSDTPHNANRVLAALSKAFNLSEIWGWRDEGTNPCRHVKAYPERHRDRTLTDAELKRLWQALENEKRQQDVPASELLQVLLLTGCRLDEWRSARWEWIDMERRVLALPDSKTGARDVHLTEPVLALLETLPRTGDLVFAGRRGTAIGGIQKIWRRIRASVGLDDVRIHDLRHTVGSLGHRAGMSQREIADLLGHKQLATTARYINSADEHKRATADRWGSVLGGLTK